MTVRCPYCRRVFDYREAVIDEAWEKIIGLLHDCSPHGMLMLEYVMKFGVDALRIKPVKVLRLLKEASACYKNEQFVYDRKVYKISSVRVADALRAICNRKFDGPLTNHNYLKKIMIPMAEKEKEEKRAKAEKAQKEREEKRARDLHDAERVSLEEHRKRELLKQAEEEQ